ncbi:MAG: hypothetical protein ACYTG0_10310 [Planctomycetota bacterium]
MKRRGTAVLGIAFGAVALMCLAQLALAGEERGRSGGAGPADPPKYFRGEAEEIEGPSVVNGQKPGIEVGQYPPDFELEPIQPYADLRNWLGGQAPESLERSVMLSKLVGQAPIMLLFGSYT